MSQPVIVLGAGGHARVLIDALRLSSVDIIGVTDLLPPAGMQELKLKYLGDDQAVFTYTPQEIQLVNGIGSINVSSKRKNLFNQFKEKGYQFREVIHPSVVIASSVKLQEGVQIMAGAVIQTGSVIGRNTIINTRASIDHDSSIGDHVHVASGAIVCGGVTIEDSVHVGAGAIVTQGATIPKGTLIKAGTLVTAHSANDRQSKALAPLTTVGD